MNKIAVYLNQHLTGSVFDKESILESYSTDRSMLKVKPQLVALPETTADVRKIVRFVRQLSEKNYFLPISVRGSGLSKTGADLSSGVVISTEKLNQIREFDAHDRLVHVQSGVTLGKLNAVLAPHGLMLPIQADPNETIGSLIANAPRDNYSKKYGGITNYVDRLEVVLANGDLIHTSRLNQHKLSAKEKQNNLEGNIYSKMDKLVTEKEGIIGSGARKTRTGYPMLGNIKHNNGRVFDLSPAFFGSEGSLGIITEVILRLEVSSPAIRRFIACFETLESAQKFADDCNKMEALSVEIYDNRIFKAIEESGKKSKLLTRKLGEGYIVLVSFDLKPSKAKHRINKLVYSLPKTILTIEENEQNTADFEGLISGVTSFLNTTGKFERPNLLNDFYVPKDHLLEFVEEIKNLEKSYKKQLELFGCYSTSIYSVRPDFDLRQIEDRRAAMTLLRDFNLLLLKHSGALAGGIPEGRLKPIVIYPEMNSEERSVIAEVKNIFDKNNVLAPEIKSSYDTRSAVRHLRTEPLPGFNS